MLLPTAAASASPTSGVEGTEIVLSAAGSDARSGDTTINSYRWTQVTSANGNTAIANSHANYVGELDLRNGGQMAAFTIPERFTAGEKMLHFRLRVTDDDGNDDAHVSVTATGDDDAPTATIRAPATAATGSVVTLIGNAEDVDTDNAPGANPITYSWTCAVDNQPSGTIVVPIPLADANAATTTFTAPEIMLTDTAGNPVAINELQVGCSLTIMSGGKTNQNSVTITIVNRNSEVVNDAILPEVLRNVPAGINRSIYQRIQERQRQDGKWK